MDVGTGSGILAIFSAAAGSKKVYAVEASDAIRYANVLIRHHV
jgi:protein arginine N-methyltransferase 1